MREATKRKQAKSSVDLAESRDAVIRACSIDTCVKEMVPYYDMTRKLVRAWGSDIVAIMLFVGEDWLRGHKNWFPLFVAKTHLAPGYRHRVMMFNPRNKIMCDFSIEYCFGGSVMYYPDQQDVFLKEALKDSTLKERLAVGMKNFGMKISVDQLIEAFTESLHEGQKYAPEKLFG